MGRTKTAPRKAIKAAPEKNEKIVFTCSCCGKQYVGETAQKRNFPASQSQLYKGNGYRLTTCKNCIDRLFEHYTEVLGDENAAIRRVCMKFDMYYSESAANSSRRVNMDRSKMQSYVSNINLKQSIGKTFDDTLDAEKSDAITNLEDLHDNNSKLADVVNDEPAVTPVSQDDIRRWGFGFLPEDYMTLNAKYDEIRSTNVIDNTTREELVRDYCKQKLLSQKAFIEGNWDQYSKLTDMSQKTMDRANLTPKIADAADKAGEKPIGVMIQMFEKEDPAPEPLPEWRDVDGIVRLFTIYFLGHLCKMLNIRNKYSALYEAEMNKYRVEIPEYNDESDEDIFSHLINGDIPFHPNTSSEGGEADGT